jgi:hypothetical protein
MAKKKPYVIIRRSGYYVNAIINDEKVIKAWKENNVPRTNPNGIPDKDGIRPQRTIKQAVRATMLSFAPATEREVERAKAYAPEYKFKYGYLRG